MQLSHFLPAESVRVGVQNERCAMLDVNEDSEYRQLKEQVKSKELKAIVWMGVAGITAIAALIFFSGGIPLAGGVMDLGVATSPLVATLFGTLAAFAGYKSFRTGQDVRFDTQELQARRDADNLSRAMGQARSPEEQVVMGHTMNKQREGRRKKEEQTKENVKKWVDTITPNSSNIEQAR